jgi:D-arabinose 1-dehydrogenase-like Zn-dependent alcohol dehydrogenase
MRTGASLSTDLRMSCKYKKRLDLVAGKGEAIVDIEYYGINHRDIGTTRHRWQNNKVGAHK